MVRRARRRFDLDDDEDWDDYDPRYFPKKVFKDGRGPRVHLALTDASPYARRQPTFDARNHMPQEARVADADSRQRARVEDAREAMINRNEAAWTWGKPGVRAPVAIGDAREAWIRRNRDAWRTPTPRFDLDTTRSAGNTTPSPRPDNDDEDNGFDIATDPYARNYWSSVEAIRSESPDNAARVEAAQRRMSMSEPNATAASVTAESRRYRPRDSAAAIADRDSAYAEYCRRIENEWRR
jgi:hypothetical protein